MAAQKADAAFHQVTNRQGLAVAQMAREMGVSLEQFQEGTRVLLPTAIRAMKQPGTRLKVIPPIVPPSWGGRVHVIEGLDVIQDQPWNDAINEAGPNTPDHYDVRKVEDCYLPTGAGPRKRTLVLVNLAGGGDFAQAIAWAGQYDLKRTNPREVFAVGKRHPDLNQELGMDPMYVVASQECSFGGGQQVCNVWFGGSAREAGLRWVGDVRGPDGWVAFSRE